MNRALLASDWKKALDLCPDVPKDSLSVLTMRVSFARGAALEELGRTAESADAYTMAGAVAQGLGWRMRTMNSAARLERLGARAWNARNAAEALRCFDASHPLRLWLGEPLDIAKCEANIGAAATTLGQYARALEYGERALLTLERVGNIPQTTVAKENLGNLYRVLGDLTRSEALLRDALDLQRKHIPAEVPGTLNDLGALYRCGGEPQRAIEVLEEARKLIGASTKDDIDLKLMVNLGTAYRDAGRIDDATASFTAAADLARQRGYALAECKTLCNLASVLSPKDFKAAVELDRKALAIAKEFQLEDDEQAASTSLARDLFGLKDYASAADCAQRSLRIQERLSGKLPLQIAQAAREVRADAISIGVDACRLMNDSARMFWFLEHGRAQVLLAALGSGEVDSQAPVPPSVLSAESDALAALDTARSTYLALLKTGSVQDAAAAKNALTESGRRLEEARERVYQARSKVTPADYPGTVTLQQVQADLRDGEVVVMYSITGAGTSALLIDRGTTRIEGPWATSELDEVTRPLRGSGEAPWTEEMQRRAQKAIVGALKLRGGDRRVIVVPDGFLAYVPFQALLLDRDVVLAPSVSVYRSLVGMKRAAGDGIIALGDPAYPAKVDPALAALLPSLRSLPRLTASRTEVERIGGTKLLGTSATAEALAAASAGGHRRAIHLACHAVIDPERPHLSFLALTPPPRGSGVLTVRDIAALKLEADLITLSACRSGIGKVTRVEGIAGFTRTLLIGGARDVLVSLWKVDDEATALLMERFYKGWAAHGDRPRALREAQASLRAEKRFEEPRFWAAWQLWGCGL